MADRPTLPEPLHKRDLLFSREKKKGVDFAALGDAYVSLGRLTEAVAFYVRAEDTDRLREMKQKAIEGGDTALLIIIADAIGEEVTADDWARLADTARRQEKLAAAAEAYEKAGRPEEAEKAREELATLFGRPSTPEPAADGDGESDSPDEDLDD